MSKDKKEKPRMTKDVVPTDFTMALALVDAVPVVFFGINFVLLGRLFGSGLFLLGALLCLWAGAAKVLWKIIVVLRRKNIWFLFLQIRMVMPVGFLLMLLALIVNRDRLSFASMLGAVVSFPAGVFFLMGVMGMVLMGVFAAKLDSSDLRANWIEQLTNGISQICFFLGILAVM